MVPPVVKRAQEAAQEVLTWYLGRVAWALGPAARGLVVRPPLMVDPYTAPVNCTNSPVFDWSWPTWVDGSVQWICNSEHSLDCPADNKMRLFKCVIPRSEDRLCVEPPGAYPEWKQDWKVLGECDG